LWVSLDAKLRGQSPLRSSATCKTKKVIHYGRGEVEKTFRIVYISSFMGLVRISMGKRLDHGSD